MHPEPHYPAQGPLPQPDGSLAWHVWAPRAREIKLVTWPEGRRTESPMEPVGYGFFRHVVSEAIEGLRYAYRLPDGSELPDPASRWQPEGVHKPSAVCLTDRFEFKQTSWRGIERSELVIYELHVGTFTPEGTFEAVIPRLAELRELGITAIELMPLAQFPGERNWGYDGVHPFAAQNSYGGPHGLARLVDAAHTHGLAVILDVVYNHLGPEGNYLHQFGPYFTDRYHTPWGMAVNFDGADSDPVRRFVIDNACMWVRDFHIDGLRLDAVHAIYDFSAWHILAELQDAVQQEAARAGRLVHVIAESSQDDVRLINPAEKGGYALDGTWSDDFHHSVHALLTGESDGYYADFGEPEDLAKAYRDVFIFNRTYSQYRRRRHGTHVGDAPRDRFVVSIQNHDQVGNRVLGDRFGTLLEPPAQRLACALLLLSPNVPLLFMGEEYGERRPFPFFCSFGDPQLIEAVRRGRREEFANLAFKWSGEPSDPQDAATLEAAKLSWDWSGDDVQAGLRRLYQDLLAARRTWPSLVDRQHTNAWIERMANDAPVVLLERGAGRPLLAVANLSDKSVGMPPVELKGRERRLSTEDPRYAGLRTASNKAHDLLPFELVVFDGGTVNA